MLRANKSYQDGDRCILLLFDLRSPKACEQVHHLRAVWQGDSDLEALGRDHMVVYLFPDTDRRIAA
jgi:hypothetical protein